jgi:hypothetical protein
VGLRDRQTHRGDRSRSNHADHLLSLKIERWCVDALRSLTERLGIN